MALLVAWLWAGLARAGTAVQGYLDLALVLDPVPLDLGSWRGERGPTRRCGEVDLSGSTHADVLLVRCVPEQVPDGATLSCEPVAGSEAQGGQPLRYQVCVEAEGCCGKLDSAQVRFSGADAHNTDVSAVLPLVYRVAPTGLFRCWWLELGGLGGLLVGLWFIAGWMRPHDFDPANGLRIAGSEAGLKRSSELVLAELPGGRRGFYRNARVCLDGEENPIRRPRQAAVVVEAAGSGTTRFTRAHGLQVKSRRTGQWEPVPPEELAQGYQPGAIYRAGSLYLKFA